MKKTKDQLCGIYRHDLRSGEIVISYNDEDLQYSDPAILTEDLPDGSIKVWRQEVDFVVPHSSGNYHVTGFIALREEGSTSAAGFTLMRRGRVIVGGYENCYRPEEVFEKPNSYVYQRLFGELNLDEWPVTQTKDAFDWHNGLEDRLIDCLVDICRDYAKKAKTYRVRQKMQVPSTITDIANEFEEAGIIEKTMVEPTKLHLTTQAPAGSKEFYADNLPGPSSRKNIQFIGDNSQFITFKHRGRDRSFEFVLENSSSESSWLAIEGTQANIQRITLNVAHPFFDPYTAEPKFLEIMIKFAFALALAESDSRSSSIDGRVDPSTIRKRMNESLKAVVDARSSNG